VVVGVVGAVLGLCAAAVAWSWISPRLAARCRGIPELQKFVPLVDAPDAQTRKLNGGRYATVAELRNVFKAKPWNMPELVIKATVGVGGFGRVRLAKFRGDPSAHSSEYPSVALKILRKADLIRTKAVERTKGERSILKRLDHPFIVNLIGTFQDEKRLFIVLEFVNGGELFSHLRLRGQLQPGHARMYIAQLILVFEYIHSLRVAYRDLKPENVLIDCQGYLKLADFGFAKVVTTKTWTLCGTPEYLAPETIRCSGHGPAVDWWAIGVLLFELLAGYPPFYGENPFETYQKVLAGGAEFPRNAAGKPKHLIKAFLVHDPEERLQSEPHAAGAQEIKDHPWFDGFDWDACLHKDLPAPYLPAVCGADDVSLFDRYPESVEASAPAVTKKEDMVFVGF